MNEPRRLRSGDPDLPAILNLVQRSFAYMDARIDPPSSMHRLTLADIDQQCESGEVWSIGSPPVACMFMTLKEDCFYLGKVAVEETARGQGLAKRLFQVAEDRARAHHYSWLELQSRVELIENHQTFAALGFVKVGEDAHEGFDRPTSIRMRKKLLKA